MSEMSNSPVETSLEREDEVIRDYSQEDYRKFWTGPGKTFLHKTECKIIQEILPPSSKWFVDIGCGYGRLLPTYVDSHRQIVLVDYAVNALEIASQRYCQENIHFIAANAYHLPFRDEVFSVGLCVRLFHHMKAPQSFLNEFARIFHEGSSAIVSYSNKRNLLRILRYGLRCFRRDHEEVDELLFITHPAYFAALSRNAGFGVQCTRATGSSDQILRLGSFFDRLLGRMPFFILPVALTENIVDRTLGLIGLAPLHFALLRKETGTGKSSSEFGRQVNLIDILACPYCSSTNLREQEKGFTCLGCGRIFPRRGKIFDFRCEGGHGNE